MKRIRDFTWLTVGTLIICVGCAQPGKGSNLAGDAPLDTSRQPDEKNAPSPAGQIVQRTAFTARNNPTTRDRGGEPSLDDFYRPAVWVYIDGKEGGFIERDGNPQVQWQIQGPVSASPTFRVEAFAPLLGTPKDFLCTLDTIEASDGSKVAYAIKANEGTFILGRDYSLLCPGENFVIRNRTTGDVVSEVAPLVPGTYLLAAGAKNTDTGKEGLAITYFTVREGDGE